MISLTARSKKNLKYSSRDLWKTPEKWPLVIHCPYIIHQYYLGYLQTYVLPDH